MASPNLGWGKMEGCIQAGRCSSMKNSLLRRSLPWGSKKVQEEVNWVKYMDAEAKKTMIKMSRDVFAIATKEPSDPSKFIMPTMGSINNWT